MCSEGLLDLIKVSINSLIDNKSMQTHTHTHSLNQTILGKKTNNKTNPTSPWQRDVLVTCWGSGRRSLSESLPFLSQRLRQWEEIPELRHICRYIIRPADHKAENSREQLRSQAARWSETGATTSFLTNEPDLFSTRYSRYLMKARRHKMAIKGWKVCHHIDHILEALNCSAQNPLKTFKTEVLICLVLV